MKNKIRAILIVTLLAISAVSYAGGEKTVCHRKYNDGMPINVEIYWNISLVRVNDIYTRINGYSGEGTGIQTASFVNKNGMPVHFAIMHHPGYPLLLVMRLDTPYKTDADGTNYYAVFDRVLLSCSKSFDIPFQKRMYSEQN